MKRADKDRVERLRRLQTGDTTAQARFWTEERPGVYGLCARVLGEGAVAEEIADEVLVDFLFGCIQRLTHHDAVGPYLRLMATRRSLRAKTRLARRADGDPDRQRSNERSPEAASELQATLLVLERCLEHLTPKAKAVINLRFIGDLTQEQIGRVVGGSKQYIGRVIKESLRTLRACLDRAEGRGSTP